MPLIKGYKSRQRESEKCHKKTKINRWKVLCLRSMFYTCIMIREAMLRGRFNVNKMKLSALNPLYDNRKRYGSGGKVIGIEPYVQFYIEHEDGSVSVPRNFIDCKYEDKTQYGRDIDVVFSCKLREEQQFLTDMELGVDTILNAYCGFGKSVSGAYLISRIKKNTLIICPTFFLCKQWYTELSKFLSCSVEIIKRSDRPFEKDITIITYSLASKLPDLSQFGCVILDEGHKIGASTYAPIMYKLPAKYRILLTATWYREDMITDYMKYHFSKIIPVKSKEPPALLYFVETEFTVNTKYIKGYNNVENEVNNSPYRQGVIHYIMDAILKKERLPILIGKRKEALTQIASHYPNGVLLTSETMKEPTTVDKVRNKADAIFGISQLIKEGVDVQKADVLLIVTPHGSIEQAIGRIIRKYEGKKKPIVLYLYDYISQYRNTINKALDNIPNAQYSGTINYKQIAEIL